MKKNLLVFVPLYLYLCLYSYLCLYLYLYLRFYLYLWKPTACDLDLCLLTRAPSWIRGSVSKRIKATIRPAESYRRRISKKTSDKVFFILAVEIFPRNDSLARGGLSGLSSLLPQPSVAFSGGRWFWSFFHGTSWTLTFTFIREIQWWQAVKTVNIEWNKNILFRTDKL